MPPDPPGEEGPHGPFLGHSHLLHHQQPLMNNFIETPGGLETSENDLLKTDFLCMLKGFGHFALNPKPHDCKHFLNLTSLVIHFSPQLKNILLRNLLRNFFPWFSNVVRALIYP